MTTTTTTAAYETYSHCTGFCHKAYDLHTAREMACRASTYCTGDYVDVLNAETGEVVMTYRDGKRIEWD